MFYGVPHPYDGYPQSLGASLARSASQVENWDQLAANVDEKRWVSSEDTHPSRISMIKIPDHPDGKFADRVENLASLIPRKSMRDTFGGFWGDLLKEIDVRDDYDEVHPTPDFGGFAEMGVLTKGCPTDPHVQFVVSADLDYDEFQIWDARFSDGIPFGEQYAAVDLHDKETLLELSQELSSAAFDPEPPPASPRFNQRSRRFGTSVADGMWARPAGYLPLTGDPFTQNVVDINTRLGESATGGKCLRDTQSGTLCQHDKPLKVGGVCAAGHRRLR